MCRLLFEILTDNGYNVELIDNGVEAIEKIKSRIPQLVLLDVKMPRMNGLDTAKEINKIIPGLPIIFISAYSNQEIHGKYIISKPFDINQVLELVKEILTNKTKEGVIDLFDLSKAG
ncbi:MAG: response regulator [Firmicutes bacterium]|nr:response regulator [Bacillota bacterium]